MVEFYFKLHTFGEYKCVKGLFEYFAISSSLSAIGHLHNIHLATIGCCIKDNLSVIVSILIFCRKELNYPIFN